MLLKYLPGLSQCCSLRKYLLIYASRLISLGLGAGVGVELCLLLSVTPGRSAAGIKFSVWQGIQAVAEVKGKWRRDKVRVPSFPHVLSMYLIICQENRCCTYEHTYLL